MNTEIKALLNEHFPQFEASLRDKIAEIGTLKTFTDGETLMRTGQYFTSTMLIVDGMVKLYRQGDEGDEFFMYYLEPGQACALSMICATKNEASQVMAKATRPTNAILVPLTLMDQLMREYRTWYYFVLETYRSRFEELLVVIDSIAFKAMDERLEFYLQRQSEALNTRDVKLTHQEIANDLGTSREVISRLLKKMEQRGMIKLHRNHIEIKKM